MKIDEVQTARAVAADLEAKLPPTMALAGAVYILAFVAGSQGISVADLTTAIQIADGIVRKR